MTSISSRLEALPRPAPDVVRQVLQAAGPTGLVALAAALAASAATGMYGLATVGLAAALVVAVPLPDGGEVPLGLAVVVVMAVLLLPGRFAVVAGVALGIAWPVWWRRLGPGASAALVGVLALAATGAGIGANLVSAAFGSFASGSTARVLAETSSAALSYAALDISGRALVPAGLRRSVTALERRSGREVWLVAVALSCSAALFAIAYYASSLEAALVAGLPLFATRFSFARLTGARRTYHQTVTALAMLPEVAGKAPVGHGERVAVYVSALAESTRLGEGRGAGHHGWRAAVPGGGRLLSGLGYGPGRAAVIGQLMDAAKLHHIGEITLHEEGVGDGPADPEKIGEAAAEVLQSTGFLGSVAPLVREVVVARPVVVGLPAAIVRVCCAFDELAGSREPPAGGVGLGEARAELLSRFTTGAEERAARALVELLGEHPGLVEEAIAAGAYLTRAAACAGAPGHEDAARHEDDHVCA
ncbi:MAG: hypothetical protein ACYDH5_15700 [Acidimicrobiales bacterium]